MIYQQDLFENALAATLAGELGAALRFRLTLTDNRRSLISIRRTRDSLDVRLSRVFALADGATIRDLASFIRGEAPSLPPSVREFANRQPVSPRLARKALRKTNHKGKVHDLRKIALSVSERYFGSSLKANVTWGKKAPSTVRKSARKTIQLGSYDMDLDLITIHPALDCDTVPVEYVELIVYHEMLHKKLGADTTENGKRVFHTPRFRRLEREHEYYARAIEWEKKNINRLLKRR